jgi:hypothetical protein
VSLSVFTLVARDGEPEKSTDQTTQIVPPTAPAAAAIAIMARVPAVRRPDRRGECHPAGGQDDSANPGDTTACGAADSSLPRLRAGTVEVVYIHFFFHHLVLGNCAFAPHDAESVLGHTQGDQLIDGRLGFLSAWEHTYDCGH